jgi:hypothetical protein
MKKLMSFGLIVLGLSLMNFTTNSKEEKEAIIYTPSIITHTCADGTEFDYYDLPEYTEADHVDIIASVCGIQ